MMAPMKRFLVPVTVFAVGFGLGYALTWLLVGGNDSDGLMVDGAVAQHATGPDLPPAERPVEPPQPGEAIVGVGEVPVPAAAVREAPVEEAPSVNPAGEEAGAAEAEEPAADDPTAEPGEDPTEAPAEPAEADEGLAEAAADDAVGEAEPEGEPAQQWFEVCKDGRTCVISWGGVKGGLSVRRGNVKHGAIVNWRAKFADARRVAIVSTDEPLTAKVHSISLDRDGVPSAARVTFTQDGKTHTGIIAMQVGKKRVTMTPK